MLAVRITDTRDFMKKLLTQDLFDTFLLSEASVTTFTTFSIDGTWHPDYFEEPLSDAPPSSDSDAPKALTWKLVRPLRGYLNFQKNIVTCTTGTSLRIFTLDKTLDSVWDEMALRFFRSRQIPYENL